MYFNSRRLLLIVFISVQLSVDIRNSEFTVARIYFGTQNFLIGSRQTTISKEALLRSKTHRELWEHFPANLNGYHHARSAVLNFTRKRDLLQCKRRKFRNSECSSIASRGQRSAFYQKNFCFSVKSVGVKFV